jgi:hypothetical protein
VAPEDEELEDERGDNKAEDRAAAAEEEEEEDDAVSLGVKGLTGLWLPWTALGEFALSSREERIEEVMAELGVCVMEAEAGGGVLVRMGVEDSDGVLVDADRTDIPPPLAFLREDEFATASDEEDADCDDDDDAITPPFSAFLPSSSRCSCALE